MLLPAVIAITGYCQLFPLARCHHRHRPARINLFRPNLHRGQPKIANLMGKSSPKCDSQSALDLHLICT
jgi:hypothetical protein